MNQQANLFQLIEAIELPISCLDFLNSDYQQGMAGLEEFKKLVKSQKRILSKKYHPDKPGGDIDKMKAVNNIVDFIQTLKIEPPIRMVRVAFQFNGSFGATTSTAATGAW